MLVGIIGSAFVLQRPDTDEIEIIQDGVLLYQLDLAQEEDRIIEIEYEGRVNTVEIRDHQICMREAECPDNTCVHMGWLDSSAPIVCLPNHLVIQFCNSASNTDITIY